MSSHIRHGPPESSVTLGRSVAPRISFPKASPFGWIRTTWRHILSHVSSSTGNPPRFTKKGTPPSLSSSSPSSSCSSSLSSTELTVALSIPPSLSWCRNVPNDGLRLGLGLSLNNLSGLTMFHNRWTTHDIRLPHLMYQSHCRRRWSVMRLCSRCKWTWN